MADKKKPTPYIVTHYQQLSRLYQHEKRQMFEGDDAVAKEAAKVEMMRLARDLNDLEREYDFAEAEEKGELSTASKVGDLLRTSRRDLEHLRSLGATEEEVATYAATGTLPDWFFGQARRKR
ncbi:hypothetical protein SAMN05444354_118158 [Stigmatella aurantiaca]|uniref:Uncharacterized protein n=1 Tax=Stigmatella aurantiaca TaxID=41 RepID=A0A1H7ZBZ5_STIAU|nr:hypothetical protein [Stigmatella aurantiaca]SEM55930.1 hypothetical protein SAMN05444354_118158 [Stigmatella aurantiaca]